MKPTNRAYPISDSLWTVIDYRNPSTLPQDSKEVLATILYGSDGIPQYMVIPSCYTAKHGWSNTDCGEMVIAWMPKPEPYQIPELRKEDN